MTLLITLTLTSIAGYFKITLAEEIKSLFAGLIAFVCLLLSVLFAPLFIKLALFIILLLLPKAKLI